MQPSGQGPTRRSVSPPTPPALALFCLLGLVAIVAAYASLLPLGRWQGDEYLQSALARAGGWSYVLDRVTTASPRPASELTLFLYFRAVDAAGRALVEPFLLAQWTVLAVCCFATMRPATGWTARRVLIGTAVLAMFLLGHPIAELFFWPDGAAPYLQTVAATTIALFLELDRRTRSPAGRAGQAAALTVAALSSEAGAMFAGAFAALHLLTRPGPARRLGLSVPAALAAAVLLTIFFSNHVVGAAPVPGSPTFHRPLASLLAAFPQWLHELAGPDDLPHPVAAVLTAATVKALFFVGVRSAAGPADRPTLLLFAAACLLAAFLTIASAYVAYAGLCCSRHAILRQCWFVLALAALAAATASPSAGSARLAPACLLLSAWIPFVTAIPGLRAEHRLVRATADATASTWRSGRSPGPDMTVTPTPDGPIVNGANLPPGRYRLDRGPPWFARGVMLFFRKQAVDIRP